MAEQNDKTVAEKLAEKEYIQRSSDEQKEANEASGTTLPKDVERADTTTVITDPQAPNAVQIPDPEVYPNANATVPRGSEVEAVQGASPNEVAAGEADADVESEPEVPADEPEADPDNEE